jgi:hypothetical protein
MFVSGCTGSIGADEDSAQNGQIEKGSSEAMPYPYDHSNAPHNPKARRTSSARA